MKKAFSLLELIFAIVIIGLLASVAIPKLMNTKSDAMVSTIKKDVITLTSAIQSHYLVNGSLDDIADVITLNSSLWDIEQKSVTFKDNETNCIIIKITDDESKILDITVTPSASTLCQKLNDKGVVSASYNLY